MLNSNYIWNIIEKKKHSSLWNWFGPAYKIPAMHKALHEIFFDLVQIQIAYRSVII